MITVTPDGPFYLEHLEHARLTCASPSFGKGWADGWRNWHKVGHLCFLKFWKRAADLTYRQL